MKKLIAKFKTFLLLLRARCVLLLAKKKGTPGKTQLLVLMPWMEPGGGEKVTLDIVAGLPKTDFDIHIVKTLESECSWEHKYRPHVQNLYHLARMLPARLYFRFVGWVVESLNISTIFIASSFDGYQLLPWLKSRYPHLHVVDILHSEGSPEEKGGFPAIAARFDSHIDQHVVISKYLKRLMEDKHNVAGSKLTVIYNAVDLQKFRPRPRTNSDKLRVCYLGRFGHEKKPLTLVEIANELVNNRGRGDVRFTFAGDGHLYPQMLSQVEQYGLQKAVDLPGYVEDVPGFLAEQDVLLITSEIEGIPLVIMEAMAMGVVVISTQVGAVDELVVPGETGYLVDYSADTFWTMSDHIEQLADKQQLLSTMSRNSQQLATDRFSLENFVASYVRVLSGEDYKSDPKPLSMAN